MPYRQTYFANEEIYHVFNRSVARQPIFQSPTQYRRVLKLFDYYRYFDQPLRFSYFNNLEQDKQYEYINIRNLTQKPGVEILAFCIMPNHYHLLVKQKSDNGISQFIRIFQNSYAKYFNVKNNRSGAVFQAMFKGVHVETDEQLLHVCRYIHLNPVTAFLIEATQLKFYPWSSFGSYIGIKDLPFVEKDLILSLFNSKSEYEKFVYDRVDYQRELAKIKHLIFDYPDV